MTRDHPIALLINLVRRVPVLAIDLQAAEARGDHAQVAYARAMQRWCAEVRETIAELQEGNPLRGGGEIPDAFARVAEAAALMRAPAAG